MLGIGSFFDKFKNRAAAEVMFRSAIIEAVKETLGYEPGLGDISYTNGIISLKGSSAAKSALMVKKPQLLSLIQKKTARTVVDIR